MVINICPGKDANVVEILNNANDSNHDIVYS